MARNPPKKSTMGKKLPYLFLMVPTREAICCLEMRSRAWGLQETVKRLNQFSANDKTYFFPSHSLLLFNRVIIQPWWIDNPRIVILTRLEVTWKSYKPTTLSRLQRLYFFTPTDVTSSYSASGNNSFTLQCNRVPPAWQIFFQQFKYVNIQNCTCFMSGNLHVNPD